MIELKVLIDKVDYGAVADKVITLLAEKDNSSSLTKVLSKLNGMPKAMVRTTLEILPQDTKDELAIFFLSCYKEKIVTSLNQMAKDENINISIQDVLIEKHDK